jgi:hypothetical protein
VIFFFLFLCCRCLIIITLKCHFCGTKKAFRQLHRLKFNICSTRELIGYVKQRLICRNANAITNFNYELCGLLKCRGNWGKVRKARVLERILAILSLSCFLDWKCLTSDDLEFLYLWDQILWSADDQGCWTVLENKARRLNSQTIIIKFMKFQFFLSCLTWNASLDSHPNHTSHLQTKSHKSNHNSDTNTL